MAGAEETPARKRLVPEYATEIVVALLSVGLLVFIKLADSVTDEGTRDFDARLLLMLRDSADPADPLGPPWLEVVVRDISALGGVLVLGLVTLAACGYLWIKGRHRLAIFVALCVAGGSLVNTLLKMAIDRPRPDIVPHGTEAALSSFPSAHAMMSAAVFLTLGALLALSTRDARIKIYILAWSVALTVLVGTSRVYLGVHWPSDIIAGWIAGATWAVLCLAVGRRLLPETRFRDP